MGRFARFLLLVLVPGSLAGCASSADYTACTDRGDADPAIAACSRVIRTEKARRLFAWLGYTRAGPFELAAAHRVRGIRYLEKGEFADARDDFAAATGLNPEDRDARFGRAVAYQKLGDQDAAIADFTDVIRSPTRRAFYYSGRGRSHQAKGDHDRAVGTSTEALKLDPGDPFY